MAQTIIEYVGDGIETDYVVQFPLGYLSTSHVTCRVNNEVDGLGEPVFRGITWLSATLARIQGAVPTLAAPIVFTRTTPVDDIINNYEDGAAITEENLDESAIQPLMAIQELLDGRFDEPLAVDLDMGGNQIKNVAPGTEAGDVVTYEQLQGIPEAVEDAEAARDAAEAFRNQAETFKNAASASATDAFNSAALAFKWANEAVDVPVSGGLFSAFHWAQKALAGTTAALISFTVGATGIVGGNVQLALENIASAWGKLDRINAWSKMQRGVPVALTAGATVNIDFSLGNIFTLTTGANNFILANPTNAVAGQSGLIIITQGGTARTMTTGGNYKPAAGSAIALTNSTTGVDCIYFYVVSPTYILISANKDFK